MHLLLTDRLTCPRCGPGFGLILLADRVVDRRVHEGSLGCPNCRDRFPITRGFADLRAPPRTPLPEAGDAGRPVSSDENAGRRTVGPGEDEVGERGDGGPEEEGPAVRVAAMLGVAEGPGHLALVGGVARLAARIADLVEGVEVLAVSPGARHGAEREGVSRMVATPGLPFRDRSLRGVALGPDAVEDFLDGATRVVMRGGRVAALDPPAGTRERLEERGLSVVLDDPAGVVAAR